MDFFFFIFVLFSLCTPSETHTMTAEHTPDDELMFDYQLATTHACRITATDDSIVPPPTSIPTTSSAPAISTYDTTTEPANTDTGQLLHPASRCSSTHQLT